MTADLRTRIADALRRHDANMDGADPAHDADDGYGCCAAAVMAVVQSELDALRVERDRWKRDFFTSSVQRGEVMHAQQERDEAFSANMRLAQQRDDAEATLTHVATAARGLMLAAEKLVLDWPSPGTPGHRRAVAEAVHVAERRLAHLPANAGRDDET